MRKPLPPDHSLPESHHDLFDRHRSRQQAVGPREGVIVNELFEDAEGALQLRFYCYTGLRGKTPGGPEEQAEQAWMDSDQGYRMALLSTLQRTRELLDDGRL
ncbi:hypothetical protein [Pseudoduganella chitinolytica]|uniref:DUF1857 family protein n=1 Tax=Pseudoduganella chitinolytica TaxID=34070 RepID=A0ABY8BEA9_9BURK|nr:hypothetical protein [Pseudoduganella chitinolytica]WEF34242.1 hypothetical protein PX653_05585 [Pseudoduganella chitinolytica]